MSENLVDESFHPPAPTQSTEPGSNSDEEIYCPICNYNLTGITTGRCPECGSFFNRDALISNQKANRITVIPWDDPAETKFWPRFKKTLRICLFDSKRFAFAFSVQPQQTRANSFLTMVCFGVCVLSLLVFLSCIPVYWLFGSNRFDAADVIVFGGSIIVAAVVTILAAAVAAGLVLGVFCPHFDGKRHLKPWLSISAYASAHYLMIPLGWPIYVFLVWWSRELFGAGIVFGFIMVGMACGLLNAFTLSAVVRHRGAPSGGRSFAVFAVFFIYALFSVIIPMCLVGVVAIIIQVLGL